MTIRQDQARGRKGLSAAIQLAFRFPKAKAAKKMSHKDLFMDSVGAAAMRSYMVMPGQPVWMDRNYNQFAMEAYVRNVIAHRAMGMVSGAAASVKLKLYATNSKGVRRELKVHPVLEILKQPNPAMAAGEFFQALYQYRMISGNAFVQAVGPKDVAPLELHLLRPDRMAVIAGKATLPAGYRYTVAGVAQDFPVDRISGRSRILHLKNFHPLNDWYGLSPVEAAAYSIDQHNQSGAWNQALLQNGARPSGALVVRSDAAGDGTLSEDQYSRVKSQIDEQFTGSANAGRPLLLEGGLDWKEMSLTPKDMDFVEAKNSSARDIALAFGVPPQLLGIPGDNTYSNLQEARLALWEQTVVPLVCMTADALNSWLLPMFGEQLELMPDTGGITALAIRNQAIWDRVEKATFLTEDEKRAAVGYAPLSKTGL
jgi:HK97 family phage portal protein